MKWGGAVSSRDLANFQKIGRGQVIAAKSLPVFKRQSGTNTVHSSCHSMIQTLADGAANDRSPPLLLERRERPRAAIGQCFMPQSGFPESGNSVST
jgi:hypothetical protein